MPAMKIGVGGKKTIDFPPQTLIRYCIIAHKKCTRNFECAQLKGPYMYCIGILLWYTLTHRPISCMQSGCSRVGMDRLPCAAIFLQQQQQYIHYKYADIYYILTALPCTIQLYIYTELAVTVSIFCSFVLALPKLVGFIYSLCWPLAGCCLSYISQLGSL